MTGSRVAFASPDGMAPGEDGTVVPEESLDTSGARRPRRVGVVGRAAILVLRGAPSACAALFRRVVAAGLEFDLD